MKRDLRYLVSLAMPDPDVAGQRPVVEKDLLHYDILFALRKGRFLDGLVFQGGTALRLCHGAPRFSEDLDFVGGTRFTSDRLAPLSDYLTEYMDRYYGLPVTVRPPVSRTDPDTERTTVARWRLSIVTRPSNAAVPHQRINLEIANVPSHANGAYQLAENYGFLPAGLADTVIQSETREEIMADKLVAFPARLPSHVRWRDIWDIHWLARKNTGMDIDLVRAKIRDYRIKNFTELLEAAVNRLPHLVESAEFANELARFLPGPLATRTIRNGRWREAASNALRERLSDLRQGLGDGHEPMLDDDPSGLPDRFGGPMNDRK